MWSLSSREQSALHSIVNAVVHGWAMSGTGDFALVDVAPTLSMIQ